MWITAEVVGLSSRRGGSSDGCPLAYREQKRRSVSGAELICKKCVPDYGADVRNRVFAPRKALMVWQRGIGNVAVVAGPKVSPVQKKTGETALPGSPRSGGGKRDA